MTPRPSYTVSIGHVVVTGLPVARGQAAMLRSLLTRALAQELVTQAAPAGLPDGARLRLAAHAPPKSGGAAAAAVFIAHGIARALREGNVSRG